MDTTLLLDTIVSVIGTAVSRREIIRSCLRKEVELMRTGFGWPGF